LIIGNQGLKGVSTAKLAKAAGVSKSTVFHHFQSSDELLTSTLNFVFEELLQSIKREDYRDVEHFLDAMGHSMFQVSQSDLTFFKALLSFFHEGIFNPKYREILISYAEQMNELFSRELTELSSNSVKKETIESVSSMILPMMDGIGFHYLLNEDGDKCLKIWELQKQSILRLLNG
jgi:AcrR family transcriptional regulator